MSNTTTKSLLLQEGNWILTYIVGWRETSNFQQNNMTIDNTVIEEEEMVISKITKQHVDALKISKVRPASTFLNLKFTHWNDGQKHQVSSLILITFVILDQTQTNSLSLWFFKSLHYRQETFSDWNHSVRPGALNLKHILKF